MGRVYRAIHHPSGRVVAVKLSRADATRGVDIRHSMLREAAAVARLRHPNVVQLLDVSRLDDGRVALVMELVDGPNLAHFARAWPGRDVVWSALDDVLAALVGAHSVGVIHCDIKPQNLLTARDGRIKIADFGVARLVEPLRELEAPVEAGTPYYMAPEQWYEGGTLGPWTDLYAVGSILATWLCGRPPFSGASLDELMLHKLEGLPVFAPRPGLQIPAELDRLLRQLLDPEPRRRPRFAAEVRARLAAMGSALEDATAKQSVSDALDDAPTIVRVRSQVPRISRPDTSAEVGLRLVAPDALERATSVLHLREPVLVGRRAELSRIEAAIDEVLSRGEPRLLAFSGKPGVGKSALARWTLSEVEARGLMESVSTRYDLSEVSSGTGLRHALARLLGAAQDGEPALAWSWLAQDGVLPFDARRLARWLADPANAPEPAEAAELATGALLAAAGRRPMCVWLDDLGWARDGGIELVERLLEHDAPVLVVATLRSGTVEHSRVQQELRRAFDHPRAELLEIGPLELADRVTLVTTLVPTQPNIALELARIDETPLVLSELVTSWAEAGLLGPDADVEALLRERPAATAMDLRIDGMLASVGARAEFVESVLMRAAVLGIAFDEIPLRAACALAPAVSELVDDALDLAALAGLLRPEPAGAYRFGHGLVREALVARLMRAPFRAEALRQVADGLVDALGLSRPELMVHAAGLLRLAGDKSPRPWKWLADGAIAQARSGRHSAARAHLWRAREWLEEDQVPEIDERRALAVSCEASLAYHLSRWDVFEELASRAAAIHASLGNFEGHVRLRKLRMQAALYRLDFASATASALALLDELGGREPWIEAQALHCLSEIASLRGDYDDALRHAARGAEVCKRVADPQRTRLIRCNLAEKLALVGRMESAWRLLAEIEKSAALAGDRGLEQDLTDARVRIALLQGRADAIPADLELRLRAAEDEGDQWRATFLSLLLALSAAERDPREAVTAAVRRFIETFERMPHDEVLTQMAMDRLATRLSAMGLVTLADRVAMLLDARREAIRRAFEEQR